MASRSRFVAFLLLSASLAPTAHAAYPDVATTLYQDAYDALTEEGIVEGYTDGLGRPYAPINRAEALKVAIAMNPIVSARARWYERHLPGMPLFSDVDQAAWYSPYVEAAFEAGIVTGFADATFRPGNLVTTEEALALLLRANGGGGYPSAGTWYTGVLSEATEKNLFAPDDPLMLEEPITRGQFFNLAYRLDTVRRKRLKAFPGARGSQPTTRPVIPVAPVIVSVPPSVPAYRPWPTQPVIVPSAPTTAPVPGTTDSSTYFAISMPSIGINDLRVNTPTDPFSSQGLLAPLQSGVGHLFGNPGQGTKVLIYGHSSSYSWDVSQYTKIFRGINALNPGDRVYVNYRGTVYTYEVTYEETVPAADMSRYQGEGEELILYTCWPPDSIAERYLVHAKPVSG